LKLDFVKAYDRVENNFLWGTMEAMGFCTKFIRLVQGLALLGTTKIHFNGIFTDAIQLGRGVKQGCPAAPGLFALLTQPLMLMLNNAVKSGKIEGISINLDRYLLHQLFADDMGLFLKTSQANFCNAKEIIDRYKRISGAQLNLSKSFILPLRAGPILSWVYRGWLSDWETRQVI
jgi:hypothetical protein